MSTAGLREHGQRPNVSPQRVISAHGSGSGEPEADGQRKRVCILGASLDVGNRGVLALAVSIASLIERVSPGAAIAYHYPHRTGGPKRLAAAESENGLEIDVFNCRMSPRSRLGEHVAVILLLAALFRMGVRVPARRNPWLRSLLEADFIGDITGGDSFSDIYGFRRFALGSLPLISAALLNRPFTMLPQTYGPFRRSVSRRLASFLLRRAANIYTRDRNCAQMVAELSGRVPQFSPDVAFALDPILPDELRIGPQQISLERNEPLIGVNISGLLFMGGYTGRNMFRLRSDYRLTIERLLHSLLESTNATILLIPHVFGSEREEEACATLFAETDAKFPGRIFVIESPLTERELKWVIGRMTLVVASRMHACIAALSQGVPAVGLAYSDKFLGVFDSVGMAGNIIDLRKSTDLEITTQTLQAWHDRLRLRTELQSHIETVKSDVVSAFDNLINSA
jgi:colanic acid/amylovoran biosynthesis protein